MHHHVGGAILIGKLAWYDVAPTGELYKFNSAAKRYTNLFEIMPQLHQALYKFSSAANFFVSIDTAGLLSTI